MSAVIGGEIAGIQKEGKIKNVFCVSLTMFLFNANEKKRFSLKTGESLLEFFFKYEYDQPGKWQSLGWFSDVYGEWEDIEYD